MTATCFWVNGQITEQKVIRETATQFITDDVNQTRWWKRTGLRVGAMRYTKVGLRRRSWWTVATARLNGEYSS